MLHPPLRVVLDTSAIVAFTWERLHVGEVIAEVADEGGAVGLPTLCLTEAVAHSVSDRDRLNLLVAHPACEVIEHEPLQWHGLAELYRAVGRLDAATAALIAATYRCHLLSAVPQLYAGLPGGGPIIPL